MFRAILLITLYSLFIWPAFAMAYGKESLSPESMNEWQVEGRLNLRVGGERTRVYFTWTQTGRDYRLTLREKSMVDDVVAEASGALGADRVETTAHPAFVREAEQVFALMQEQTLFESLPFWLRGLQAGDAADVSKQKQDRIFAMHESGWDVRFDDYSPWNDYFLPRHIQLKSDAGTLQFETLRAETGFITHWCSPDVPAERPGMNEQRVSAYDASKTYRQNGVDRNAFCAQLAKVHGGVIDPKKGVFGPDSMMWEINRYIAPPGVGSGRALILQISHPWITAGIDEHSDVRNDPMERARRTFVYMYSMVFGSLPQAMGAANEVHQIHRQIEGNLPYQAGQFSEGDAYWANQVDAMIWVHSTLWETLVYMYERIERELTEEEKAQFYEETKLFAMLFGVPVEALPATWDDFIAYNQAMWESDTLAATPAAKALKKELFRKRNPVFFVGMPVLKILTAGSLPPRLRDEYEFRWTWFDRAAYKTLMFSAKVADRVLMLAPYIRENAMYQEAEARVNGQRAGWITRTMLKVGVGEPTLVN